MNLGLVGLRIVTLKHQNELVNRIEDYLQNLENNQETSRVILKQLEILQSLVRVPMGVRPPTLVGEN